MFADYPLNLIAYLWLPSRPVLSGVIWLLLVMVTMYFARLPVHRLITVVFGGLRRMLRLLVKFLHGVNARLQQRNRDVLLARGRENCQRNLERQFVRIADQVAADLSVWPSLHRDMRDQITRMDKDYTEAAETPPQPPEWLQVIDAVAQVSAQGSAVIAKILADIHVTLKEAMEKSLHEYQLSNANRHTLLGGMLPQWRTMQSGLDQLDAKIAHINEQAQKIDACMETYESILRGTDQTVQMLTRSAASNLLFSSFLLLLAVAGGVVNFQLLALPVAEVVGVHGDIWGMPSSDVATAVILMLQIILGMFVLEAAGVTRLLPDIALLERRKRRGMLYLLVLILLVMAGMEALLIYTRDALLADNAALNQLLAAPVDTNPIPTTWIPAAGQVVIGFLLPLLLIFSVIAFETFIHALRQVSGMFLSWLLDVMAMLLRLLASLLRIVAQVLTGFYDVLIFLPLSIERSWPHRTSSKPGTDKPAQAEPDP